MTRFSLWLGGLIGITALASLSLAVWLFGRRDPLLVWLAVLIPWGILASLLQTIRPYRLAWGSGGWQVGALVSLRPTPGQAAHIAVAVDLGFWLLLRWQPVEPGRRCRSAWLPLQRRGLEPHWHGLRCAVYSAAPAPGADAAADH